MYSLHEYIIEKLHLNKDIKTEHKYTFAGYEIAPGNVVYRHNKLKNAESWEESSNLLSISGMTADSTFFSFEELGKYFDGTQFDENNKVIENKKTLDGGWRIPTRKEWENIMSNDRTGSIVNGKKNCCWSLVYFDDELSLVLYPDDEEINDVNATVFNNKNAKDNLDLKDAKAFIEQGCAILGGHGYKGMKNFTGYGKIGLYTTADAHNSSTFYALIFEKGHLNNKLFCDTISKFYQSFNVRLIR